MKLANMPVPYDAKGNLIWYLSKAERNMLSLDELVCLTSNPECTIIKQDARFEHPLVYWRYNNVFKQPLYYKRIHIIPKNRKVGYVYATKSGSEYIIWAEDFGNFILTNKDVRVLNVYTRVKVKQGYYSLELAPFECVY